MLNTSDAAVVGVPDVPKTLSVEESAYRKATWRIIPLLAICFGLAYLDRVNISFAKLQMQSDLGLSDAAYGIGAGIFFIGYFVFEIPSNMILQRLGARKWISIIMIVWGIVSACMMMVREESWFYILRFIIGAAEAGFMPGVMLYFTYWFPAKKRAQINALFLTSVPLSGVFGGPIAGLIMTHFDGWLSMPGWQWLFLDEGIPTVLFGVVVWFCLTDRPAEAAWLTREERQVIEDNLAKESGEHKEHRIGKALVQKETWFLCALFLFLLIGLWGFTFWLPELIKQTGFTNKTTIGFLSAIPYAAGCVAMLLIGHSSDRTGERQKHLGFALLAGAAGFLLSGWCGASNQLSLIALTLAAVGTIGCLPVFWSMPAKVLAGSGAAGGIALINSVGNLAGAISPWLVGHVKQLTGSTDAALYMIAASMAIATAMVLAVLPKKLSVREHIAGS